MSAFPQQIIARKRDGGTLSESDIESFVAGLCDNAWSDAQVAALAMAIVCRGMQAEERTTLTRSMLHSGNVLKWPGDRLRGPVVDKHSTGGVGDKVSLILAPLLAACGCHVPMISGRGLAHTGGTLDKLESIPGFRTDMPLPGFQRIVEEIGCAIVGQSAELVPADRRFYAIRDVTGTVPSKALIVASILSKKLAAGLAGLVMDIKCGSGGFMTKREDASQLAREIVATAKQLGLPTRALITDMGVPLGTSVGHALEIREVLNFLSGGHRDPRLAEVTLALCKQALAVSDVADADASLNQALDSGRAAEYFARMVAAQGGPTDVFAGAVKLAQAPAQKPLTANDDGFFAGLDALQVGTLVLSLGGGRQQVSDPIDAAVGFSDLCPPGTPVQRGDPLAVVHARDAAAADAVIASLSGLVRLDSSVPKPVIFETP